MNAIIAIAAVAIGSAIAWWLMRKPKPEEPYDPNQLH